MCSCNGELHAAVHPHEQLLLLLACVAGRAPCRALRLLRLSLLSGNLSTMKTNRGALVAGSLNVPLLWLVASVMAWLFTSASCVAVMERLPWHDALCELGVQFRGVAAALCELAEAAHCGKHQLMHCCCCCCRFCDLYIDDCGVRRRGCQEQHG